MPKYVRNNVGKGYREFITTDGTVGANTSAVLSTVLSGTPAVIGKVPRSVAEGIFTGHLDRVEADIGKIGHKTSEEKKPEQRLPEKGEVEAQVSKRFIMTFWAVLVITLGCLLGAAVLAIWLPAAATDTQKQVINALVAGFTTGFGALVGLIGGKSL